MKLYKICNKISLLLHVLASAAGYFVMEAICRHSFIEAWNYMTQRPLVFAYNAAFIFTSSLIVYLFHRRVFWRVLVTLFWLILAIINGVLLLNRVTPFTGPDLHLITDAMKIANKYLPVAGVVAVCILFGILVILLLMLLIKGPKYQKKIKYRYNIPLILLAVALFAGSTQLALEKRVLSNYFGNIAFAYQDYGYPYCLATTIFNTGISCPRDYSEKEIKRIEKTEKNLPETQEEKRPNILFLQLESFFDPTLVNYLDISEDPIPTFRKLMKEYSSGYYKVPSVGAGTANTEFESITGMSMHYFGPGEYPYKSILKETTCESAPYVLKNLGYTTHAVHNNEANFYGRRSIFPNLGFDTFTSEEYMARENEKNPNGWVKDEVLTDEILKCLDSTEGPDYVYTISVQGHGDYPTEPTLENPEIKVTGVEDEGKRNAWEYYVNEVHEMDKFVGQLIDAIEQRGEPTVIVFYGDHLPTLGLEAKDLKGKYLYNTNYVIWDNIGLEKKDGNIAAYQIMAEVFDRLDIHTGTIFNYHQQRRQTKNYLADLELLQYDIMYGKQYVYKDSGAPITEGHMVMGVKDATITSVVEQLKGTYSIYGENFTKQSKVYINGEKQTTKFLNNTRLDLKESEIKDGDQIMVAQCGSSNTIFRTSKTYEYTGGQLVEVTDQDTDVENGRQAFVEQKEEKKK